MSLPFELSGSGFDVSMLNKNFLPEQENRQTLGDEPEFQNVDFFLWNKYEQFTGKRTQVLCLGFLGHQGKMGKYTVIWRNFFTVTRFGEENLR